MFNSHPRRCLYERKKKGGCGGPGRFGGAELIVSISQLAEEEVRSGIWSCDSFVHIARDNNRRNRTTFRPDTMMVYCFPFRRAYRVLCRATLQLTPKEPVGSTGPGWARGKTEASIGTLAL
jgi:hypothetical protein